MRTTAHFVQDLGEVEELVSSRQSTKTQRYLRFPHSWAEAHLDPGYIDGLGSAEDQAAEAESTVGSHLRVVVLEAVVEIVLAADD